MFTLNFLYKLSTWYLRIVLSFLYNCQDCDGLKTVKIMHFKSNIHDFYNTDNLTTIKFRIFIFADVFQNAEGSNPVSYSFDII